MKIWLVFIRQTDSVGGGVCRWIDSMWADNAHAVTRAVEVRDSIRACGASHHEVFYTTGEVADLEVKPKSDAKALTALPEEK